MCSAESEPFPSLTLQQKTEGKEVGLYEFGDSMVTALSTAP